MVKVDKSLDTVLVELLQCKKKHEIDKVIHILTNDFGARWIPVGGDKGTNYPTIKISSNPGASIIERVTNSIDAKLESLVEYKPHLKSCRSPRELITRVYGIKGGHISNIPKERREVIVEEAGIVFQLHDGDSSRTPTIDVRDHGIGISAEKFSDTILSLNKTNKISKWYVMGRFGQGGSTTFGFCEYAIIISKPMGGHSLSFTIVGYYKPQQDWRDGQYMYLVNSDGLPFSVNDSVNFGKGTLVRHINYEIGPRTLFIHFYSFLEMYLFDPVLPFWAEDQRNGNTKGERRRIFGSRDRLERSDLVQDKDSFECQVGENGEYGTVSINYWVFKSDTNEEQKRTFIEPENPIVITYLGQTHDTIPRRILHKDLKFGYLYKDLAIQIDCDGLNELGRRKIFTSTREVITKEGEELLKQSMINVLSQNEKLEGLEAEREREFFAGGLAKSKEEMRQKLAELINRVRPGTFPVLAGRSGKDGKKRASEGDKGREKDPLPTKEFPTYIKIANKRDPIEFRKNQRVRLELETDAPDGFLTDNAGQSNLELISDGNSIIKIVNRHKDFKGGRMYLLVELIRDQPIGMEFMFGIRLSASKNQSMTSFEDKRKGIITHVLTAPASQSRVLLDAPEIEEVGSAHPFWINNNWNEDNVAEVRESNRTVIYVSTENKYLVGTLTNTKYTETKKESIRNKYVLHIAFHAYIQYQDSEKLENQAIDAKVMESMQHEELVRAARTLLTALTSEKALEESPDLVV